MKSPSWSPFVFTKSPVNMSRKNKLYIKLKKKNYVEKKKNLVMNVVF